MDSTGWWLLLASLLLGGWYFWIGWYSKRPGTPTWYRDGSGMLASIVGVVALAVGIVGILVLSGVITD